MCMEPKCLYSSWFKEPKEVAPGACHFESGGSSSRAKKKVVHARRRRALSETNPGGLSTKIQGIAARQPSFHLCYQATLPSHSGMGQQKTTSTPSCDNMGAPWSSLHKRSILQRTPSGLSACRLRSQICKTDANNSPITVKARL